MDTDGFALHLGHGVYLLADGSVVDKPPPAAVVSETESVLPFDAKTLRDTLGDVKKALDGIRASKDVQLALRVFAGVDDAKAFLGILAGISAVIGALAPVTAVVAAFMSVLTALDVFRSGPSDTEKMILERIDALRARSEALAQVINAKKLAEHRGAITDLTTESANIARLATSTAPPTQAEVDNAITRLSSVKQAATAAIGLLTDQATWQWPFNRPAYQTLEAINSKLVRPDGSGGWAPVRLPANDEVKTDHRLMAPMACYATSAFLASIRAVDPAHRSNGNHRDEITTLATKLRERARGLLEQGIARTHYTEADFSVTLMRWGKSPVLHPSESPWHVGAVDMRAYDDTFFRLNTSPDRPDQGRQYGALTWKWVPPRARLRRAPFQGEYAWVLENPAECAADANALAAQRYAELLAASGYYQLLQTAALCDSEAAEPSQSQTVRDQAVWLMSWQHEQEDREVSVRIPFTNQVISADAHQTTYSSRAIVSARTAGISRGIRAARYKVALRALDVTRPVEEDGSPAYLGYQNPRYRPANPGGPRNVLDLSLDPFSLVDEAYLVPEWTTSPLGSQIVQPARPVSLRAPTFSWWVPVPELDISDLVAGVGPMGELLRPKRFTLVPGSPAFDVPFFGLAWSPPSHAQEREVSTVPVQIDCALRWEGSDLWITLDARTQDRSFVVFVVIEEHFLHSGQVMHTAIAVPFAGSRVDVPESFFEREKKAWSAVGPAIRAAIPLHIPTLDDIRPPGPVDTWRVTQAVRDLVTGELTRLETDDPALLRRVTVEFPPASLRIPG